MMINNLNRYRKNIQWLIPSTIVYLVWVLYILLDTLRYGGNISYQIFTSLSALLFFFLPLGYIFYAVLQKTQSYSAHIANIIMMAGILCTLLLAEVYLENTSLGLPFGVSIYLFVFGVGFLSLMAVILYSIWIFSFSFVQTLYRKNT